MASKTYRPLLELTLARVREFFREPAAVFWVYVFPLLIAVALGIAFREKPVEKIVIDVRPDAGSPAAAETLRDRLAGTPLFEVRTSGEDEWKKRLHAGKTDLVVVARGDNDYEIWNEPNRAESVLARHALESFLNRPASGGPRFRENRLEEKGNRYIDFLLPGLLGMNLMGGGLFGVGFVLADMRVRKLLKRYLATPMRRTDFLLAVMLSRILFTIPEVLLLLLFGWLAFGVTNQGSLLSLVFLIALGAFTFAGMGLLVASRAQTIESVSGLMNLIMLPMWILSGVFFSAERFPDFLQPFIQILPLTALNDALRGVMLEGRSLGEAVVEIGIVSGWGLISFVVALKIFRWQ